MEGHKLRHNKYQGIGKKYACILSIRETEEKEVFHTCLEIASFNFSHFLKTYLPTCSTLHKRANLQRDYVLNVEMLSHKYIYIYILNAVKHNLYIFCA